MNIPGFNHEKRLSPKEPVLRGEVNHRYGSSFDTDQSAYGMYPHLLGKLGEFEIAPEIISQFDPDVLAVAPENVVNLYRGLLPPAINEQRGMAQLPGMIATIPTVQFEAPHEQNQADYYGSIS